MLECPLVYDLERSPTDRWRIRRGFCDVCDPRSPDSARAFRPRSRSRSIPRSCVAAYTPRHYIPLAVAHMPTKSIGTYAPPTRLPFASLHVRNRCEMGSPDGLPKSLTFQPKRVDFPAADGAVSSRSRREWMPLVQSRQKSFAERYGKRREGGQKEVAEPKLPVPDSGHDFLEKPNIQ